MFGQLFVLAVRWSACYPSGLLVQSTVCVNCVRWSACYPSGLLVQSIVCVSCFRWSACFCVAVVYVQVAVLPARVELFTHLFVLIGRCSPVRLAGLSGFLIVGLCVWPGQVVCCLLSVSVCLALAFPVGNVFFFPSFSVSFSVCWLSSFVPCRSSFRLVGSLHIGGTRRCGRTRWAWARGHP